MSSAVSFQSVITGNYCTFAASTLMCLEYFTHLPKEIDLFWKGRLTGASVLFLTNRYLSLLSQILAHQNPTSDKSCAITVKAYWAINLLPFFCWAVFSASRTYVLAPPRLRWWLGMLVLFLSSVPIGINFTSYHWLSSTVTMLPRPQCIDEVIQPLQLDRDLTIISRTSFIVADLVVLGVTWHGTYRTVQLGNELKHTYSGTLLRDGMSGTTYFLALTVLNVLHLLLSMLSIDVLDLSSLSMVTIFTEPIASILVSRFLLDLQEVHQYRVDPQLSSMSVGQGSLRFATRVIGSLGESLPPPGDTSLEDKRLAAAEDASEADGRGDEVGQDFGADAVGEEVGV
ncbi:hypothetical protein L226DRAFT_536849 [Lentinus tigrinus ALCF2SS1-7]|uniref:uncharacterized protein n=1 Tax=Lentinus tigrinus ALCF2SS1-7 TaxID=1328758 RepID=UPI0011663D45|nr:hypothetical protein L226DRAFT_536849 [Lentinus tigrinus ALCF2SS1-7]